MKSLPSPVDLAGTLIPTLKGIPAGSASSVVNSFPGDLVMIASMFVLQPILSDILTDVVPSKFSKFSGYLATAARASAGIYATFLFDGVFVEVLGKMGLASKTRSVLFGALWWLPTRISMFTLAKKRIQWVTDGESDRGLVNRAAAVGVYLAAALLVTDGLSMKVSQSMGFVVMPALVALLQ